MATGHRKVIRRSLSPEEWIRIRLEEVKSWLFVATAPTQGWSLRPALYKEPGKYGFPDPWRSIEEGDWWGEPDGTFFFKNRIRVPKVFSALPVELELVTPTEMLLRISGRLTNAFDPNRSRISLLKKAQGGERFSLEFEAYVRSAPDDGRVKAFGGHGCVQSWRSPRLVSIDPVVERFLLDVELAVDVAFCEMADEEVRSYLRKAVDKALQGVDRDTQDRLCFRRSLDAAGQALKEALRRIPAVEHPGRLALVGHSHIDVAYHWTVRQGVRKNARTCLVQLALMDDFPEMLYCHTQPFLYEQLEIHYPELFERIKKRVEEGRWELVGGPYVEPDCNIPSGESLIRQCLLGKRYFLKAFGKDVDTCWLPDVFGNSWILPQILRRSGIRYFVSNKMSTWNDTNAFPHNNFRWRGVDGTEVYACVPASHFISWLDPDQLLSNWVGFQEKETVRESMNMYGFGDGGGGLTREMLERARRIEAFPGLPKTRLVAGKAYLDEAFSHAEDLSVWDDELYLEMHRGTFTTKGLLKRLNRKCESTAREAEIWSSLASLQGIDYPGDRLTRAWKKVLVNQFHDILPGSHTTPVGKEAEKSYRQALKALESVRQEALEALSLDFSTKEQPGVPWLLFNALGWERDGLVEIPVDGQGPWRCVDADGERCPSQLVGEKGVRRLLVWSPTLSCVGGCVVYLQQGESDDDVKRVKITERKLENPFFKIRINQRGEMTELWDKRARRSVLSKGQKANMVQLFEDKPGVYEAWDIVKTYQEKSWDLPAADRISVVEEGPLRAGIQVERSFFQSRLVQRIWIYAHVPRIDFETRVDWHEHNKLLKVAFPVDVLSRRAAYDLSYGAITRPTHQNTSWDQAKFEVCGHQWADLSEASYGVSLLNDCKYGYDIQGNTMRLSLLRGPIRPDPDSDQGEHSFTYSLYPHLGTWQDAGTVRASRELNDPIFPMEASRHDGRYRGEHGYLNLSGRGVHLGALKRSEDSEDLILRLVELHGGREQAGIDWDRTLQSVKECDLLERTERNVPSGKRGFSFSMLPFQIRTFRLVFGL